MKLVLRFVAFSALAASAMGCTMTQKVAGEAGVDAVTGFAVGGPIGAGAVAGGVAVPVATSD